MGQIVVQLKDEDDNEIIPIAYDDNSLYLNSNDMDANFLDLFDIIYPLHSIFISTKNQKPPIGTWTSINGRFLLGAGITHSANEIGGAEEVVLTIDEMPKHSHQYGYYNGLAGSGSNGSLKLTTFDKLSSKTGGNQAHNNMPPYQVVYMWERTA